MMMSTLTIESAAKPALLNTPLAATRDKAPRDLAARVNGSASATPSVAQDGAAGTPAVLPSLNDQLAAMRDKATKQIAATASGNASVATDSTDHANAARDAEKAQRQAAKEQAKEKIMALLERLKQIKKFAGGNPETTAKMLAQLVKDLKNAVDDYAAAGGLGGGSWQTSLADTSGAPQATSPAETYQQMRDAVMGSEVAGDMDIVKTVKGMAQGIRDLLTATKIATGVKGPDDETRKAFDDSDSGLRDLGKLLDKMDRAIRESSPAAGMFVALVA